MKHTSLNFLWVWLILACLHPHTATAQCGCAENFETTFPNAVKEAPVVIEGREIPGVILFGGEYNDDYESTKIIVYKVLKGNINAKEVELIDLNISISHGCSEGTGTGVFMLYPSEVKVSPRTEIAAEHKFKYRVFSRIGCNVINYDKIDFDSNDKAHSPYGIDSIKDLKKKIYNVVEKITQQAYKEIAPLPKKDFGGGTINAKSEESQAVNISSISPTTITAGTFDTLIIRGSGFTPEWLVQFRNPEEYDEKYITLSDNHYIIRPSSTNDTLYKVLVPCVELNDNVNHPQDGKIIIAGTGKVALKKGNTIKKSGQTLTVSYARDTYAQTDTSAGIYPILLPKNNSNGDFMFWLHPTLRNNALAKELVTDAIEQWRCTSGVNFTVACDTISFVPKKTNDNISTISFTDPTDTDFYSFVGTSYKAITLKRLRFCSDKSGVIVAASDIIFRNHPPLGNSEIDWYYQNANTGAISSGEHDFYTVALHELGHAHLLDHVIDHVQLMDTYHFPGNSSVIHEINPTTDLVAANDIMAMSVNASAACFPMQAVTDCALPDCASIDCDSPGYPLQVGFSLMPEVFFPNPDFDNNSDEWQMVLGANVSVVAKDQSIGNIIDRAWSITTDPDALFSNEPCDISSDLDTCRLLYWNEPGPKQVSLTVTDANACQITHTANIQIITPNCSLPSIGTQIIPTQTTCDLAQSICPNGANGQIIITPPNNGDLYNAYTYFAQYHATDPTVSTAQDLYSNNAFVAQSTGIIKLTCLPEGYYKIKVTDEISTCQTESIVYVPSGEQDFLLTDYSATSYTNSTCQGNFKLNKINNAEFDPEQYTFVWSDCVACNTPTRSNLCYGIYTLTVTDKNTGCYQTLTFTIHLTCSDINVNFVGGASAPIGESISNIEIWPTAFESLVNIKLTLNYETKVSLDLYNIYGNPVKKLIDGEIKAPGEYYLQDNTNNISDGVYFYVIKACGETKADVGIKE